MIGPVILIIFAVAVFLILWDQDRRHQPKKAPLPEGSVQMPLDMLHGLMDELDAARLHAGRLRRGMEAMIDHWPGHFSPAELDTAKELVHEAAEVGL